MLKLLFLGHPLLQLFEIRFYHGDLLFEVLHCHWYVALHYLYNTLSLSVSIIAIPTLPLNFYVTCRAQTTCLPYTRDRTCVVADLRELSALQNIQIFATYLQWSTGPYVI